MTTAYWWSITDDNTLPYDDYNHSYVAAHTLQWSLEPLQGIRNTNTARNADEVTYLRVPTSRDIPYTQLDCHTAQCAICMDVVTPRKTACKKPLCSMCQLRIETDKCPFCRQVEWPY